MGKYIVRRLLWMVVVLFFVSLITFLLAFAVPGDPAKSIAGTHATPEILARIRHTLGLDEPLWKQYGLFLWHLLHGNMGYSYETQLPVTTAILQRFPATVMIAMFGIFFELLIGIPIGMTSALKQYGIRDRTFTVLSLLFLSMPMFFLGMLLMYFFAFQWQIFPLGGYEGWTAPLYGILPGLTIGLTGAAWYSRLLRSSMLDILSADFVKAARAKGLPERTVVWRHIMRNALEPDRHAARHGHRLVPRRRARHRDRLRHPRHRRAGLSGHPDAGPAAHHGDSAFRRSACHGEQFRSRPCVHVARPAREVQLI